jgi:hypothetical protein
LVSYIHPVASVDVRWPTGPWERLKKGRATQQRENYGIDDCQLQGRLLVVKELHERGWLNDEDELPEEGELGLHH